MIEHVDAIANIDEILSVPGIDVAFIGPNDLLNSMGTTPAFDSEDPEFVAALDTVLASCQTHGIAAGIHVITPEIAQRRAAEGFQFIALGSDSGFMLGKAHEVTTALGISAGETAAAKY